MKPPSALLCGLFKWTSVSEAPCRSIGFSRRAHCPFVQLSVQGGKPMILVGAAVHVECATGESALMPT